jgi:hypothetical protein
MKSILFVLLSTSLLLVGCGKDKKSDNNGQITISGIVTQQCQVQPIPGQPMDQNFMIVQQSVQQQCMQQISQNSHLRMLFMQGRQFVNFSASYIPQQQQYNQFGMQPMNPWMMQQQVSVHWH